MTDLASTASHPATTPDAAPVVAFFDVDRTILAINSADQWARHAWREGELRTRDLIRAMIWLAQYRLALVNLEDVLDDLNRYVAGADEEEMRQRVATWYEAEVRQHIMPGILEHLEWHRARGHQIVLLSAATPYLCAPLCAELGADDYICTEFEVRDGVMTGRILPPACYGPGKAVRARTWAEARGVELARCYFYTDSYTDLPTLEEIGTGVVVNPDPRLARWARARGVRVLRLAAHAG